MLTEPDDAAEDDLEDERAHGSERDALHELHHGRLALDHEPDAPGHGPLHHVAFAESDGVAQGVAADQRDAEQAVGRGHEPEPEVEPEGGIVGRRDTVGEHAQDDRQTEASGLVHERGRQSGALEHLDRRDPAALEQRDPVGGVGHGDDRDVEVDQHARAGATRRSEHSGSDDRDGRGSLAMRRFTHAS